MKQMTIFQIVDDYLLEITQRFCYWSFTWSESKSVYKYTENLWYISASYGGKYLKRAWCSLMGVVPAHCFWHACRAAICSVYLIIPVLCFLSTNMDMLHEITSEDAEWEEAFADSSSNKPLQSAGKGWNMSLWHEAPCRQQSTREIKKSTNVSGNWAKRRLLALLL